MMAGASVPTSRGSHDPRLSFAVGSLFSGIGGLDVGFEAAGGVTRWAVEIYAPSARVYAANFPHVQTIVDDVRNVDATTLSPVDVLIGGFPCDPFSMGNRQRAPGHDGVKETLYLEILRFVDAHQPRFVVLENVPGLLSFDGGAVVADMHRRMEARGYTVHTHVLDLAAHCGVPMQRRRLFFTATRGLALYPQIPEVPIGRPLADWLDDVPESSDLRRFTGRLLARAAALPPPEPGRAAHINGFGNTTWTVDDITHCWVSNYTGAHNPNQPLVADRYGWRRLSVDEIARLLGFPAGWDWAGMPERQRYIALGQCVSPTVSRVLAEAFRNSYTFTR
jgi:DNA (cytosine-5)-methyltransferase 1